jgi:hypothetical protein
MITFQVGSTTLHAQNYVLSPGDSIVATASFDDLVVYNILQNNISTDTIWLSYEKIISEIPPGWNALSCDNVNCYSYLKENGDMLPVVVGEYGLMSMHVTAHTNPGTALIRYAIWEKANPSQRDTLTWIITAPLTDIEFYPQSTVLLINKRESIVHSSRQVRRSNALCLKHRWQSLRYQEH